MKLHHIEYKKNYKAYILECISSEDDLINQNLTDDEKINYLFDRFGNEYGFQIERMGENKAMAEWLSGLAINIPYTYGEIIELAVEMGSIDENPSEALEDRVIENYFSFMANIILSFKSKEVA
jgi:hypothetical protein|tara:strand:+ start:274 stop:642 length:369 start_codon:yes stop_codon:yes gene_type:complete